MFCLIVRLRLLVPISALVATSVTGATAQLLHHEPKVIPGQAVAVWQEDKPTRADEILKPRLVYARNDTTIPIAITVLRFSKCVNLSISCDSLVLGQTILPPRGYRSILEVLPADWTKQHAFAVVAGWRTATECLGVDSALPLDSAAVGHGSAGAIAMIIPPAYPSSLRGATFSTTFFINGAGNVDSLRVNGVGDRGYLAKLQSTLMYYHFTGRTSHGCPVPSTTQMEFTLGH